jgi:hypothetical protein
MKKKIYILNLTFLLFHYSLSAQNSLKKAYTFHDTIVSFKFLGINNGIVFRDYFKTESKEKIHRFFKKNDFELGSVLYDDQVYFDIPLRYDLFNDDVIIKIKYEDGFSILKLEKEKIRKFSLNSSNFVDASFFKKKGVLVENRFYEKIRISKKYSLFKTSEKEITHYVVENESFDGFNLIEKFYLLYNKELHLIKSKKDFKKILPQLKPKIYSYYKKNKKLLKKDETIFYKLLIENISKD